MFRRAFFIGGTLLLAGAMFFVNPNVVEARGGGHGGGGHGGGGHGGGFHGGGFHSGGFHSGGFNRGFNGGFNRGFNGGFNRGFGGIGLLGLGYGLGYGGYGLGYGGYGLGYGGYGYGNGYYGNGGYYSSSPYYYSTPSYYGDPGYYNYTPGTTPGYDDSLPAPTSAPAELNVNVPANAQLWVNGQKVDATGTTRKLTTPKLSPASRYSYDVKATWMDNGKPVTQTRQVIVTAGSTATVSFPTSTNVSSR